MEEKRIVAEYGAGLTSKEIAKLTGHSRNKIDKILTGNGIQKRKREDYVKFNRYFFDKIDNETKAYVLGFFYADAYNRQRNKGGYVILVLGLKDFDFMKQLASILSLTTPVKITKQGQCRICLCSTHFSEAAAKLGCFQNKSLTLRFPTVLQVPLDFIRHFIRGYFDGDGCISGRASDAKFTIVSTENFCNELNLKLSELIGLKKLERHPNNSITKRYTFTGRKQLLKIYHYLYDNSTIYLERKKSKMEEVLCIS